MLTAVLIYLAKLWGVNQRLTNWLKWPAALLKYSPSIGARLRATAHPLICSSVLSFFLIIVSKNIIHAHIILVYGSGILAATALAYAAKSLYGGRLSMRAAVGAGAAKAMLPALGTVVLCALYWY